MHRSAALPASCVVVGGGITGLSAAHRLVELGRESGNPLTVRLLERSDRLGGQVRTERVGEYLIEGGPDSLVAHKPAAARLAERIGLAPDLAPIGGATRGHGDRPEGATDPRSRRIPDDGADAVVAGAAVAALLDARQAADGVRAVDRGSRGGGRGRESRVVRDPALRPRGPRARRGADRRRALHRASRAPEPAPDAASFSRHGDARRERHPRAAKGRAGAVTPSRLPRDAAGRGASSP